MNNQQIIRCLHECATKLKIDLNISSLKHIDTNTRHYDIDEVAEFQRDMVEAANDAGIVLIEKALDRIEWNFVLKCLNKFNVGQKFIKWISIFYL